MFQSFYAVPDYQREYIWEAEQVEQLLTDVLTEQADGRPGNAREYFIGSIVVCPGEGGVFDLIDGQQRMTTLFLILCAFRDPLKAAVASVPASVAPQIASTSTNELGQDVLLIERHAPALFHRQALTLIKDWCDEVVFAAPVASPAPPSSPRASAVNGEGRVLHTMPPAAPTRSAHPLSCNRSSFDSPRRVEADTTSATALIEREDPLELTDAEALHG